MTTTLTAPWTRRPVVERYERTDGMAAALVYEVRGGAHVVRVLGESSWRYDAVEAARDRWRAERAALRARGFRRVA